MRSLKQKSSTILKLLALMLMITTPVLGSTMVVTITDGPLGPNNPCLNAACSGGGTGSGSGGGSGSGSGTGS